MAKSRVVYVCQDCGSEQNRWAGQCPDCGAWNTLSQFVEAGAPRGIGGARRGGYAGAVAELQTLDQIDLAEVPRFSTGYSEFDRVLGGGVVPGSVNLIGGQPGAGKSTLLLQVMCALSQQMEALYVTGEESLQQVALRAHRLGLPTDKLKMLAETSVESILATAAKLAPRVMVIDSVQVVHCEDVPSAPGGVAQVRESAAQFTRFAKAGGASMFLVGHVTKDGTLAGPKVLEHIIDCSIMLEEEGDSRFRSLRAGKNRFGAVNELGVFAMTDRGMREVRNPSAIFLSRGEVISPGSVVMVVWEGTRPLLVEIQALVDESMGSNPRRVAVGVDQNRLSMLLAVLHRHGGLQLGDQDVFANVVGGIKVAETSADLALLLAIVSSYRDRSIDAGLVSFGEVGLSGEIRPVPSGGERLLEAAKHGFRRAIVPPGQRAAQTRRGHGGGGRQQSRAGAGCAVGRAVGRASARQGFGAAEPAGILFHSCRHECRPTGSRAWPAPTRTCRHECRPTGSRAWPAPTGIRHCARFFVGAGHARDLMRIRRRSPRGNSPAPATSGARRCRCRPCRSRDRSPRAP